MCVRSNHRRCRRRDGWRRDRIGNLGEGQHISRKQQACDGAPTPVELSLKHSPCGAFTSLTHTHTHTAHSTHPHPHPHHTHTPCRSYHCNTWMDGIRSTQYTTLWNQVSITWTWRMCTRMSRADADVFFVSCAVPSPAY